MTLSSNGFTGLVAAAGGEAGSWMPEVWTAAPFVLFLLTIAIMPIVASHFWHSNLNRAMVAALFALPMAGYLIYIGPETENESTHALMHELGQYSAFIMLLFSLYTVSGGIVLLGDIRARPITNTAILALGSVAANFIGTTGASMLLIRPILRINQERTHVNHIPIFFIFTVSNVGGLLTPLGDPPLFLGFLNGVNFFWTLGLWREWLFVNGIVLAIFFIWDTLAYRRESSEALAEDKAYLEPIRLRGNINFLFLAGVVAAVLMQSEKVAGEWALKQPWGEICMGAMAVLSLLMTPRGLRQANNFGWHAILEVAILFAAIFITMVPALKMLEARGSEFGISEPWQFFWMTGILSSFLDNAPTYLSISTMAAGSTDFNLLVTNSVPNIEGPLVLAAISCGAVFMGANTYIGNGPNFMVKAICDQSHIKAPSFFGYMAYSSLILMPVFVLVTIVFFRPW